MTTLRVQRRNMETKAKKLRREGYVVGNVFGREIEGSIPVKMPRGEVEKFLKVDGKGSQIMLDIEGTQYDVLIKDIAYNPIAGGIDEIDFQALVSNEMVHSVAEMVFENHEKILSGVFQVDLEEIAYKALPEALVETVEVDLSGLKPGDVVKVKDLAIAADKDVVLSTDPDTVVVTVTVPHNAPIPEAEDADEEAAEK